VHTLVREDIFAGFLAGDMERFARGEKNVDLLLEKRPTEKSSLLAWKGGAMLYRAILALEAKRNDEFEKKYGEALALFDQAKKEGANNPGVDAIQGGTFVIFADRLPKQHRAPAWARAYEGYQTLWKLQGAMVANLPLHLKGELLGGLAMSSQRTGRTDELNQHLARIETVLAGTAYENVAKKWKENPKSAESVSIACLSCHEGGRLGARLNALSK
jgi:hypothetical protein